MRVRSSARYYRVSQKEFRLLWKLRWSYLKRKVDKASLCGSAFFIHTDGLVAKRLKTFIRVPWPVMVLLLGSVIQDTI